MPNGSYQGAHTTASAERSNARHPLRGAAAPRKRTRSRDPALGGQSRPAAPRSGSSGPGSAGHAPARPSGTAASAAIASSTPLRRTSRPTLTSRGRPLRASDRAVRGERASRRPRRAPPGSGAAARPCRISSKTSSLQVAMTRSAPRATRPLGARPARRAGVARSPWCRRLTLPSAWKVCTVGTPDVPGGREPASPDIQKCACTTSGGSPAPGRVQPVAPAPARAVTQLVFRASAAPGRRRQVPDLAPRGASAHALGQARRSSGGSTPSPRGRAAASARASSLTCTFCPPASGLPGAASGLACSDDHVDAHRPSASSPTWSVRRRAVRRVRWSVDARSSTLVPVGRGSGPARSGPARAGARPDPARCGRRGPVGDAARAGPGASRAGSVAHTPAVRRHGLRPPRWSRARPPACPAAWPRSATVRARSSAAGAGRRGGGPARRACGAAAGRRGRGRGRTRGGRSRPSYADAEHVQRRGLREAGQQVGAGDPAAAQRLVDARPRPRGELAGVAGAGVDDRRARRRRCGCCPASHMSALKWVTCTRSRSSRSATGCRLVGRRPARARCAPGRRRRRRGRAPGAASGAASSSLLGPLQHHDVDRLRRRSCSGETSTARGRPVPGRRPPAAPRPALGQRRQQVAVPALDERGGPGAVHVPEQDVHAGTAAPARAQRAPRRRATRLRVDAAQAGVAGHRAVPGAGVRGSAACWSPSRTCGTRYGRPARGRHDGREQRDDRGADRGGQVRGAGVADDHGRGPGQHPGQLRRRSVRPPRSTPCRPATAAVSAPLVGAAGDDHPVPRGVQQLHGPRGSARPASGGPVPPRRGAPRRSVAARSGRTAGGGRTASRPSSSAGRANPAAAAMRSARSGSGRSSGRSSPGPSPGRSRTSSRVPG